MDKRPVGIFDSGFGGLTAVKALRELLPDEDIIYFADSARVPYGAKTPTQLRRIAKQDLDLLSSYGVKAVLAACGTVSSNTADIIESYPVPAMGVIKSVVKVMGEIPGNGALGVIATDASIKSGVYQRELGKLCPDREIIAVPCPAFVPLIESGHISPDDTELRDAVSASLKPMKEGRIQALLLGCTHFGIISEAIRQYLGEGVTLVSAADSAAADMASYLKDNSLTGGGGSLRFLTSGSPDEFSAVAAKFLGTTEFPSPEHVPVMEV